ncbi:MAG: hypothetical protein FJ315_08930 [SAR202 cluster bacterium]|nr:hypothetical protein [SAR202 cluster bacterium]
MSQGVDYRGLKLRGPATLCVGASVDPSKPAEAAARLARRKVVAGAQFLVTQAVYGAEQVEAFREAYARETAHPQAVPILFGLPVLSKDGLLFGKVPEQTLRELDAGRPGDEIALEQVQEFRKRGMHHFYLVAPILRGGVRDYGAAQALLRRAASA